MHTYVCIYICTFNFNTRTYVMHNTIICICVRVLYNVSCVWIFCLVIDAQIGFELPSYTVSEDEGPANVAVILIAGELEKSVEVTFSTSDQSAQGKGVTTVFVSEIMPRTLVFTVFILV